MRKIKTARLIKLLESENRLEALERGGVDNWDWYEESLEQYREEHPEGNHSLNVIEDDLYGFPKITDDEGFSW